MGSYQLRLAALPLRSAVRLALPVQILFHQCLRLRLKHWRQSLIKQLKRLSVSQRLTALVSGKPLN